MAVELHKLACWRIEGEIYDPSKPDRRTDRQVWVSVGGDITAKEVASIAEDALLHNWSPNPHRAEVLHIERLTQTVLLPTSSELGS